jgi:hypothetical protein
MDSAPLGRRFLAGVVDAAVAMIAYKAINIVIDIFRPEEKELGSERYARDFFVYVHSTLFHVSYNYS